MANSLLCSQTLLFTGRIEFLLITSEWFTERPLKIWDESISVRRQTPPLSVMPGILATACTRNIAVITMLRDPSSFYCHWRVGLQWIRYGSPAMQRIWLPVAAVN